MFNKITSFFTDKYYRNAEMVSYWKTKDSVQAKVMLSPEGYYTMQMEGEKYPFPGFPRGVLLFGTLSPLKHWIKNYIFNENWHRLEQGLPIDMSKEKEIFELFEKTRYDMLPIEKCCPAVQEMWRAMTVVGINQTWKEIICFILQEDDAYRFRFQWMMKFHHKGFDYMWQMLEHAEVIGDMKERVRLFRRIFGVIIKINPKLLAFLNELNVKKVRLSKADKYFFRAKYFKVDYPEYQY